MERLPYPLLFPKNPYNNILIKNGSFKMNPVSENSVTIMKYKASDGTYDFKCLDKWNVADEAERLDAMIEKKKELEANGYEVLWIKTLPIFDIPSNF